MTYILFFLRAIAYTLGAATVCGLMVALCRFLFLRLLGSFGRGVVIATSLVGTPVHEGGHALMCLLFGHRITEMRLWQLHSEDGTMGYVTHAYNPRNPYHILGNLFIGFGPILSGLGVVTLILWLCFPDSLGAYLAASRALVAAGEGSIPLLREGLELLPRMAKEAFSASTPVWASILGLLGIFSVSLHIELSPSDLKSVCRALPLYLLLILLLTGICALLDGVFHIPAMAAVMDALALFSTVLTALFTVVLVTCLTQVLIAVPLWILRKLLGR